VKREKSYWHQEHKNLAKLFNKNKEWLDHFKNDICTMGEHLLKEAGRNICHDESFEAQKLQIIDENALDTLAKKDKEMKTIAGKVGQNENTGFYCTENLINYQQIQADCKDIIDLFSVDGSHVNQNLRDLTEVAAVPNDWPVEVLRGQKGLKAKRPIESFTVFPITCRIFLESDYSAHYDDLHEWQQHERYTLTFKHNEDKNKWHSNPVVADLAGMGNELMFVNDPKGSGKDANVEFVEYWHLGWPFLFAVTMKRIPEGEWLLIDYGEQYWEEKLARKRDRLEKHSLALNQAGDELLKRAQDGQSTPDPIEVAGD